MSISSATTPDQNGPGSDGNEGVLCIPQSSCITEAKPSDCLVSYLSAEKQSVYSMTTADWAKLGPGLVFWPGLSLFASYSYQ